MVPPSPTETTERFTGTISLESLVDTMTKDSLADFMSQEPIFDSQTRDLDEYSTMGFDIISCLFGVPQHEEASIYPDRSISNYPKEPICILSDIVPLHDNPDPIVIKRASR